MIEAVLLPAARQARAQLNERDQEGVNCLIALIELDPTIYGTHKLWIRIDQINFTA